MDMEKEVLDQNLSVEEVSELMNDENELADVNDLAWYFIKGQGCRWIVGAY